MAFWGVSPYRVSAYRVSTVYRVSLILPRIAYRAYRDTPAYHDTPAYRPRVSTYHVSLAYRVSNHYIYDREQNALQHLVITTTRTLINPSKNRCLVALIICSPTSNVNANKIKRENKAPVFHNQNPIKIKANRTFSQPYSVSYEENQENNNQQHQR